MAVPPQHYLIPILLTFALTYNHGRGEGRRGGLDLLGELQLHNSSREGVTLTPGPLNLRPAFYLHGGTRELRVPEAAYLEAVSLLRMSREFTVSAWVRQERANSGSLLSFSAGPWRYLEVQSSGRRDELRLHYRSAGEPRPRVETFPYRLADDSWHRLALSVSGPRVTLLVDCHQLYSRLLPHPLDTNFSLPQLALWVGQRNNRHSLFKGALQDVRIVSGPHGYLNQCPHLDADCPTCGQFSQLQDTVHRLTLSLQQLQQKLEDTEGRLSRLEECDCHKSCAGNSSIHADGATWQDQCDICACVHGEVECRPVQCPQINCKMPVLKPGECCPTCLKQCYLRGRLYQHGDTVSPKQCVECQCRDGSMHCTKIDPESMCPPLPCPPEQQFSVPDECCKFCPGVDYCAKGHNCHVNASCLNLETTYTCHCNTGYKGDGEICEDIDECLSEGGMEGHHCRTNTRCFNTPGSYECHCLPGYQKIDRFNCLEIDECATGEHKCDENASCLNTQGSYKCQCSKGYSGDGFSCERVCGGPCLNGGTCVGGGCECRPGYTGHYCQRDLDECASGLHTCANSSMRCVNMPGWYYCTCAQGYVSALAYHQSSITAICQDVDECTVGNHTCHPTAECVNNEGSFSCQCDENNNSSVPCSTGCMYNSNELEDGSVHRYGCNECQCSGGVVTCNAVACDCSAQPDSTCCPHCDPANSCVHQELPHVVFTSGERWIYQCQTCECLLGEIDCWSVECAPVYCDAPVLSSEDCCPRCLGEEDPCLLTSNLTRPCHTLYQPHSSPHCTSCNCKEGELWCAGDSGSACTITRLPSATTTLSVTISSNISRVFTTVVPAENSVARNKSVDLITSTPGSVNSSQNRSSET